ncbi:MAG: hypothetical protein FWD12_10025, partial [Alphaproteobacteria bacterium]|nr:hypothetical protein [Alphaproteobacteria bacterium]
MKKISMITAALLASGSGSAIAADLPVALYKAPPAVAVEEGWTGFYVGVNGGWFSQSTSYPGVPSHVSGGPADQPNTTGGLVGGQIGYNYQFGNLVLGVEGDFDKAITNGTSELDGNYLTESNSANWFATARGRIAYAFGNFLPYATVGGAWESATAGEACPAGVPFGFCSHTRAGFSTTDTQVHVGAVYGGGLEY